MSTDRSVTETLMEVLQDGADGFSHAADRLRDTDRPDLASTFARFAQQRADFYNELERLAAIYGDDLDESGSVKAAVHRAWMTVRDTVSGSDPDGVLAAAEQGEDHAVKAYTDALEHDISPNLRSTVASQLTAVKAAHDEVRALRDSVS